MISLHSILAMQTLPALVFWSCIALMAVAFIGGFVKGFRKVAWGGLAWLAAGAVFVFIGLKAPMEGSTPLGTLAITLLVAALSVGAVLVVYGLFNYFLRPRMRWIKDDINGDTSLAEYGLEFEPEYLDYDGEHDYAPYGKRIYKTGYGTPSLFFRLLGGATCAINVGMILAPVLGLFLLLVNGTALNATQAGVFLQDAKMQYILGYAQKYLLDFLAIGGIMLMAIQGYKKGFISSLRAIVITLGGFAAVGASFYLPFSAFATQGFMATFVEKCAAVFVSLGSFSGILGKLLAGCILLLIFSLVLVLLNVLFKSICELIEGISLTRGLDSCIAAVIYIAIGAALCVGVWFFLAALDILGIFSVSSLLSSEAYFSNALLEYAKSILEPLLAGA